MNLIQWWKGLFGKSAPPKTVRTAHIRHNEVLKHATLTLNGAFFTGRVWVLNDLVKPDAPFDTGTFGEHMTNQGDRTFKYKVYTSREYKDGVCEISGREGELLKVAIHVQYVTRELNIALYRAVMKALENHQSHTFYMFGEPVKVLSWTGDEPFDTMVAVEVSRGRREVVTWESLTVTHKDSTQLMVEGPYHEENQRVHNRPQVLQDLMDKKGSLLAEDE